jgi:hypothetical protein
MVRTVRTVRTTINIYLKSITSLEFYPGNNGEITAATLRNTNDAIHMWAMDTAMVSDLSTTLTFYSNHSCLRNR